MLVVNIFAWKTVLVNDFIRYLYFLFHVFGLFVLDTFNVFDSKPEWDCCVVVLDIQTHCCSEHIVAVYKSKVCRVL